MAHVTRITCIAIALTVLLGQVQISSGAAILSIKLLTFSNNWGLTSNSVCCDGQGVNCSSKCDHSFDICVSSLRHSSLTKDCPHGRVQTGEIQNENYINFGPRVGRVDNPMKFFVDHWPTLVLIHIDITDIDSGPNDVDLNEDDKDDEVAHLKRNIAFFPNNESRTLLLLDRVQLSMEVRGFCAQDYYGLTCDVYCRAQSGENPRYVCDDQGRKKCQPGWTGQNCTKNIDECLTSPCFHGGTCEDGVNSYSCLCPPHFTGDRCQLDVNECEAMPDVCNNGSCVDGFGHFRCECDPGFTGPKCLDVFNACDPSPCHNGGVCTDIGIPGDFSCLCPHNFTGKLCEDNIDECQDWNETVCLNNGTCVDTIGSFLCQCTQFWTGSRCEENINECVSGPCFQTGSACIDLDEGFRCDCADGWLGKLCGKDKNECLEPEVCRNNGTCVNFDGGFVCACREGWTGVKCEVDINECQNEVCENGGSCDNLEGDFHCKCPSAWRGQYCNEDIDECELGVCTKNATRSCDNFPGGFTCYCLDGWTGSLCEEDIDECEAIPTVCLYVNSTQAQHQNGDRGGNNENYKDIDESGSGIRPSLEWNRSAEGFVCTNTQPGYVCTCLEGRTGSSCETSLLLSKADKDLEIPATSSAVQSVEWTWPSLSVYLPIAIVLGVLVFVGLFTYCFLRQRRRKRVELTHITYQNEAFVEGTPPAIRRNGLYHNSKNNIVVIPDIMKDEDNLNTELSVPNPGDQPTPDTPDKHPPHYEIPTEDDPTDESISTDQTISMENELRPRSEVVEIVNIPECNGEVKDKIFITKMNYIIADGIMRHSNSKLEDQYEHLPYIDTIDEELCH